MKTRKMSIAYLYAISCLLLFIVPLSSFAVKLILPQNSFAIDNKRNLIVAYFLPNTMQKNFSDTTKITLSLNKQEFLLLDTISKFSYQKAYTLKRNNNAYTFYITQLPLLTISCDSTISDEPKVLAHFTYYDSIQSEEKLIGIELRGGTSLSYPKKTYDLEFWKDSLGNNEENVHFGSLRCDDDWILDALYNEPLRIRSFTAHNLWNRIHTLYYQ